MVPVVRAGDAAGDEAPGVATAAPRVTGSPWPLLALTLLAALLRLPTLSVQHYWIDEAVTVGLLHLDLGQMLQTMPATESTPPLYYVLAWGWTRLFGTSEFGLRSLSALAGIAVVPACFAAAREFVSDRAALLAGLLAAVSPVLVWYSQEARAYSLLIVLSTLTILFFGRALRVPSGRRLALWSAACVLALTTHYFAGFMVLSEAAWLLARSRRRIAVVLACAPIAVAAGALAPLALHQRQQGHLGFIATTSLGFRVADAAKVFVAGATGPRVATVPLVGIALGLVGIAMLARLPSKEHRRLVPLAMTTLSSIALPLVLALAGQDYVLARNLLPVWPAIAILVAAGLGANRSGWLGAVVAAALVSFSVGFCVAVPLSQRLRREAITARLSSLPGQNAAVTIAYVPLPADRTRSTTIRCPGGYHPKRGGVRWVGKPPGGPPSSGARTRRLGAGWAATVVNSSDHAATYQLTVACVP